MDTHVVLIDCPDRKGLVHAITGAFYRGGHNITRNAEFVDETREQFFMRSEITGDLDGGPLIDELKRVLPAPANVRIVPPRRKDLVVLVSREHHCLADLLVRHAYGELNGTIRAVISNHDALAPL